MKKAVKYILVAILMVLVAYKSVYVEKLSVREKKAAGAFDAVAFSKSLWNDRLPAKLDSAIELNSLVTMLKADPSGAFARYSNAMGIGNHRYSMVKLSGVVSVINDDDVVVQAGRGDSLLSVRVATEYVYGNAIRDASALVQLKDFENTADLNSISEELNRLVRTTVLPVFKSRVKIGDMVDLEGAVAFNKEHIDFKDMELMPVRIRIH